MNSYEFTAILRNKDSEALKTKLVEILSKNEVEIIEEAPWGIKKLAYEIEGETEGFYYFAHVKARPEAVSKVGNEMRLNRGFLRHLFIKTKAVKSTTA